MYHCRLNTLCPGGCSSQGTDSKRIEIGDPSESRVDINIHHLTVSKCDPIFALFLCPQEIVTSEGRGGQKREVVGVAEVGRAH